MPPNEAHSCSKNSRELIEDDDEWWDSLSLRELDSTMQGTDSNCTMRVNTTNCSKSGESANLEEISPNDSAKADILSHQNMDKYGVSFCDSQSTLSNPKVGFVGFSTAGGNKVKEPSKEAKERAEALMCSDFSQDDSKDKNIPVMGFSTAIGGKLKQPSAKSVALAKSMMEVGNERPRTEDRASSHVEPKASNDMLSQNGLSLGFSTARGSSIKPPSSEAVKRANGLMMETNDKKSFGNPSSSNVSFSTAMGTKVMKPSSKSMRLAKSLISIDDSDLNLENSGVRDDGIDVSNNKSDDKLGKTSNNVQVQQKGNQKLLLNAMKRKRASFRGGSKSAGISRPANDMHIKKFKPPKIKKKQIQVAFKPKKGGLTLSKNFSNETSGNRVSLKNFTNGVPRRNNDIITEFKAKNIPSYILELNWQNALMFKFRRDEKQDGKSVIDAQKDFYRVIEEYSSSKPDISWIENHYRHIVWKMCSYVRSFPHIFWKYSISKEDSNSCLWFSWENLIYQLRHRYDWEYQKAKRSILKKCCEQDDSPSRPMVLVVTDIVDNGINLGQEAPNSTPKFAVIGVSDGWYRLKALCTDRVLSKAVETGRLSVGQKILIYGASLIGQSEACDPLKISSETHLRLNANFTKRVRWFEKLGLRLDLGGPPRTSISGISADGGNVPYLDIIVDRKWPMSYVELRDDGKKIFRNQKLEELAQGKHEEKLQQEIDKEFKKIDQENQKLVSKNRAGNLKNLSAHELYQEYARCGFNPLFESRLSIAQRKNLFDFIQKELPRIKEQEKTDIFEKARESVPERKVTGFFKIRICDYPIKENKKALQSVHLTFWRPEPGMYEEIREGHRIKLFNVLAKKHMETLALSSSKQTKWMRAPSDPDVVSKSLYKPRKFVSCKDLKFHEGEELDIICKLISFGNRKTKIPNDPDGPAVQDIFATDDTEELIMIKFSMRSNSESRSPILKVNNVISIMNAKCVHYDKKEGISVVSVNEDCVLSIHFKTAESKKIADSIISWSEDPDSSLRLASKIASLSSI